MIADKGFTCQEQARVFLAEVKISHLELSVVRIHVERIIGVVRASCRSALYLMLSTIDKIVEVCCTIYYR